MLRKSDKEFLLKVPPAAQGGLTNWILIEGSFGGADGLTAFVSSIHCDSDLCACLMQSQLHETPGQNPRFYVFEQFSSLILLKSRGIASPVEIAADSHLPRWDRAKSGLHKEVLDPASAAPPWARIRDRAVADSLRVGISSLRKKLAEVVPVMPPIFFSIEPAWI